MGKSNKLVLVNQNVSEMDTFICFIPKTAQHVVLKEKKEIKKELKAPLKLNAENLSVLEKLSIDT